MVLSVSMSSACVSVEKSAQTADGQIIPGKRFLRFPEHEYLCAPTLGRDHTEMEQLLDRYGNKGWKLAGFMQKNGDTNAFCVYR